MTKFLHKLEVPQGNNISAFQKLKFHIFQCGGVGLSPVPSSLRSFCSMRDFGYNRKNKSFH